MSMPEIRPATPYEAELEYELRVAGPDDVIVFSYELEALQRANEINKQYCLDRLAHPGDEVLCVATVHEVCRPKKGGWLKMCSCIECIGDQPEPTAAELEAESLRIADMADRDGNAHSRSRILKGTDMLDAMRRARDALTEYYRDDAPVVAMLNHAITDVEGYDRAYELLFKDHGKLRGENEKLRELVQLIFASTLPYNDGNPTFSDKVTDMWAALTPTI